MEPFAAATDAVFADPNFGMDARWRQQGTGAPVNCRIIRTKPSDVLTLKQGRVIAQGQVVDVRASEIASPQKFDSFEIVSPTPGFPTGGEMLEILAEPQTDELGLSWQCEVKPKA